MGELAGLFTSLAWSLTSLQFTLAGRRVGSPVVNRVRLLFAALFLCAAHLVMTGALWPAQAGAERWLWLGLSGVIGLVLGDACLFQAYVLIGPRRTMLLMTLAPMLSALLAWGWLGETLTWQQITAMLITLLGVGWVTTERRAANGAAIFHGDHDRRAYLTGILLGIGAALGQAFGLLFSKLGMANDLLPLSATLMRILAAGAAIWLFTLLQGRAGATFRALRDHRSLLFILGGSFTGPFLGIWGSMIAVRYAPLGVASTLIALPPILLIPLSAWVFRETITPRSIGGALIALLGVALLFIH